MTNYSTSSSWKCPDCGREFARHNQSHSCDVTNIDDHFQDKDPQRKATYEALIAELDSLGGFRVDAARTGIHLISRHHFGSMRVQKTALRLSFVLDDALDGPRFVRVEKVFPNSVNHTVRLVSPDDIDDELLNWLYRSFALHS